MTSKENIENSNYEKYIGIPYRKENGPHVLTPGSTHEYQIDGLNCQTLVHVLLREVMQVQLPLGMWSQEIFEDTQFLDFIPQDVPIYEGDIFLFSSQEELNPKNYHLAYFTGEYDSLHEPLLIHANFLSSVVVWPLSRFLSLRRYEVQRAVKRLKIEHHPLLRSTFLPAH